MTLRAHSLKITKKRQTGQQPSDTHRGFSQEEAEESGASEAQPPGNSCHGQLSGRHWEDRHCLAAQAHRCREDGLLRTCASPALHPRRVLEESPAKTFHRGESSGQEPGREATTQGANGRSKRQYRRRPRAPAARRVGVLRSQEVNAGRVWAEGARRARWERGRGKAGPAGQSLARRSGPQEAHGSRARPAAPTSLTPSIHRGRREEHSLGRALRPWEAPRRAPSTPPPSLHRTAFATKWKKRKNPWPQTCRPVLGSPLCPGGRPPPRPPVCSQAARSEDAAGRPLGLAPALAAPDPLPFHVRFRTKLAGQVCGCLRNTSVTTLTGSCKIQRASGRTLRASGRRLLSREGR